MSRDKKRKKKHRGKRSYGRGNTKKRRGSGNRGGRGKAGSSKHESTKPEYQGDYFGRKGFHREKDRQPTINLWKINRKAVLGELEKKDGKYVFEFEGKVLGSGRVTEPLSIKANDWSKKVESKLKKQEGTVSELSESED